VCRVEQGAGMGDHRRGQRPSPRHRPQLPLSAHVTLALLAVCASAQLATASGAVAPSVQLEAGPMQTGIAGTRTLLQQAPTGGCSPLTRELVLGYAKNNTVLITVRKGRAHKPELRRGQVPCRRRPAFTPSVPVGDG
jgi:hypothetical protein